MVTMVTMVTIVAMVTVVTMVIMITMVTIVTMVTMGHGDHVTTHSPGAKEQISFMVSRSTLEHSFT